MHKRFWQEEIGWGLFLWFIGYLLGIVLFFMLPPALLGWVIMPIGIVLTLWVLQNKISPRSSYLSLAISWVLIAVVADYFFLVKIFNPVDSYYKLDVYLYYAITFILPIMVGSKRLLPLVRQKR